MKRVDLVVIPCGASQCQPITMAMPQQEWGGTRHTAHSTYIHVVHVL